MTPDNISHRTFQRQNRALLAVVAAFALVYAAVRLLYFGDRAETAFAAGIAAVGLTFAISGLQTVLALAKYQRDAVDGKARPRTSCDLPLWPRLQQAMVAFVIALGLIEALRAVVTAFR